MAALLTCGFECGVLSSGAHFQIGTGTPTISTTTVNSANGGLRSLRINPSASNWYVISFNSIGSSAKIVARAYVYFATLPSATVRILGYGSNTSCGVKFNSVDSKLYAGAGANLGSTGFLVTTGQWYLIDVQIDVSTTTSAVSASINGTALGSASIAAQTAQVGTASLVLMEAITNTSDVFFDDIIAYDLLAGVYPIGAGKVLGFMAGSDGTHTATVSDILKGTIAVPAGVAIVAGTTDAFNWINARPMGGGALDNTRLINQNVVAALEYIECNIEQTAETGGPRIVTCLFQDRQSSTSTGVSLGKIVDNAVETTVMNRNGAGVITDRYTYSNFENMPSGGTAWTNARFKAIKLRFGYSSNVTSKQYLRSAMVEAEFAIVSSAITTKKIGLLGVG